MYISIIGIWNLDFFRLMYKPFCLHQIIQSLALDYIIALYPLLLVAITYWLVSLYGRNCRAVVYLWRPLRKILRPISRDLDIKSTLIESFSTLYLLLVVKIQSVSLDLLLQHHSTMLMGSRAHTTMSTWLETLNTLALLDTCHMLYWHWCCQ